MISKVRSAVIKGIEAVPVVIETDISRGMPGLYIAGMPETTVRQAAIRVRAAILNSGFEFPRGRISINIAPADIKKHGSILDLGIAVGILTASEQVIDNGLERCLYAGELSMDGTVCPTAGILNVSKKAAEYGLYVFVPEANRKEAAVIQGAVVMPVGSLREAAGCLNRSVSIEPYRLDGSAADICQNYCSGQKDFADVKGQEAAKRALAVSAAGGHGVLMIGSPSTGKTMLAERMPGIMPPMSHEEIVKTTEVYSAAGLLTDKRPYITERPFRHPHHTVTRAGLIGGGTDPKPGEITLASSGILFIDEFAEMDPNVADALREPLEQKKTVLLRRGETYVFPADFLLIAASNPCRCGYYGDPDHECTCTPGEIMRYRMKLSGPVLERIDIHLEMSCVTYSDLKRSDGMSTSDMREMVMSARRIQKERFRDTEISLNSEMTDRMINDIANVDRNGQELLQDAYKIMKLSPRSLARTVRTARTIADIEGRDVCGDAEISEALQYTRFREADNVN